MTHRSTPAGRRAFGIARLDAAGQATHRTDALQDALSRAQEVET